MGALTDQPKRSATDLCLPLSSASPKKPRLVPPSFSSMSPNAPKSFPFRREVHAPQHIIHAFGLGSSSARRRSSRNVGMGNLFSMFSRKKQDERIDLDEYKKMVEERVGSPSDEVVRVSSVQRKSLDLSARNEEEILDGSDIVSDKLDDGGNAALELVQTGVERLWAKSKPLYKELYQKAKERDIRLNNLIFEAEVLHRKATGYRSVSELLQKERKPKLEVDEPFCHLTTEEEEDISRALLSGNRRKVLVVHEPSNLQITRDVLQCLRPGAWLNDEVINLYLELLKEREKREPEKFLKCHFFNTFFYKRLTSGKDGYDFKSVKRWTTQRKLGYALIECEKIFVPIHKEIHWCLAVINVKDESFQYLDSLGGSDNFVLNKLARYLKDEVFDKSDREIDTLSWKMESVDELPLQKNGWDCGMFMLKYADFYSRGLKLCFSQEHMAYFRKRTALEILRLKAG